MALQTAVRRATPGSGQSSTTAPALIRTETTPPAKTFYVSIPLGTESPARAMTGIFVPAGYRHQSEIDLIIYLHGFKPRSGLTIDRYWNTHFFPTWPLRERLNDSGKNVILAAPTLGDRAQSGRLTGPGGLDHYVTRVLSALAAYAGVAKPPRLGKLILACHSGGGWSMRQLAVSNNRATQHIHECWGFDCTYNRGDDTAWAQWARANPQKRLFIYYIPGSPTAPLSERLKKQGIPNVSVIGSAKGHNWVPIRHWRERIEAAPLQARSQQGAQDQEFGLGSIASWFGKPASSPTAPSPGTSVIPSPLAFAIRTNAVMLALQEWKRWNHGKTKESDPRVRSALEDYWRTGVGYRPSQPNWWSAVPWSAAFISWLMRKAGAKDFKFSAGHSYYIAAAKENAMKNKPNMFKAYPVTTAVPRVGDLVCKSRAGSGATYANIKGGMTTHCDIVTAVEPNRLLTIGGNVDNSVSQKRVATDSIGRITVPGYFAVIRVGS